MIRILFIILFAGILDSCSEKRSSKVISHVPRDTSINPANSYTSLTLDSLYADQFLKREVADVYNINRVRNFYNNRNYQFAWFDDQGLTEQGEAFWNLHQNEIDITNDSTIHNKQLHESMTMLLEAGSSISLKDSLPLIDLRLTRHFFKYMSSLFEGKVLPEEMQWHIPRRKINEQTLIDSFLAGKQKEWKPLNESFYKLQDKFRLYVSIEKSGGWLPIKMTKRKLFKGVSDPAIAQIKNRLRISGDYALEDSSACFTDSLQSIIQRIQHSFGFKATGVIDHNLINELNVPAMERIKQIKINLERMRWMPADNENRLVANIPEYRLHVFEKDKDVLTMKIVVGKAATHTVILSDELENIVFSPYWNVPASIVSKEILPNLKMNNKYLLGNNMEITGYNNEGLPIIRQRPGKGNALGKVKFIFLNRYNIYFHDTPERSLFNRQKRAFSHGCIRLSNPFELAKYLLHKSNKRWTDEEIRLAMNQNMETSVKLDHPIPVFIVYFTSWVDTMGSLQFRKDIYGHDKRMEEHLFN